MREANRWFYYRKMDREYYDVHGLIWGALQDLTPEKNWLSRLRNYVRDRSVVLPGNRIDRASMARFAVSLKRVNAKFIHGYSQSIVQFAKFAETEKCQFPGLKNISVTAEPILPEQQTYVSSVFGCPVYSIYGTRECGFVAAQLPNRTGMFVNLLNAVVEIVDEKGHAIDDERPGRIVITDLLNYAMPLIRYRIGDIGAWRKTHSDKDPERVLDIIAGRETDFLQVGDRRISGASLTLVSAIGISQLQYLQDAPDHIDIRFVGNEEFSVGSLMELEDKLRQVVGRKAVIKFDRVQRISPTASGKFRYVISNLTP